VKELAAFIVRERVHRLMSPNRKGRMSGRWRGVRPDLLGKGEQTAVNRVMRLLSGGRPLSAARIKRAVDTPMRRMARFAAGRPRR
jgi:hypothetical protein